MAVRKGDKFRFSLQWQAATQEGIAVGEFLDRLGNKKSDFVVMATWEYLQHHPEITVPDARIMIQTQPIFGKEQMLAEVKGMVAAYMEECFPGMPDAPVGRAEVSVAPALRDFGIEEMLDNLNDFDS